MKHYKSLFEDIQEQEFPTVTMQMRRNREEGEKLDNTSIEYYNVAAGFDIETTSYMVGETKTAFMYIWQIGIGHGNEVYYGRTWEELKELCEFLQFRLQLNFERRLVIYVHNLGYEFQFMRKYFEWDNEQARIFATDERKPIRALCSYGIEFRDSQILSQMSLANTAKNLAKYKVKKMVGDLDYSLIRHHLTPLSDTEMMYCENDIKVITAYIQEQIEMYKDVTKIPMTNTGRVRDYVRKHCYYTKSNHRKSNGDKFRKYRKIMDDLTVDVEIYQLLKKAFMGGFTHANANYSNITLSNVSSVDFTSSYPSVMISEKFPMSRFRPCEFTSLEHFETSCVRFALVFEARFTNIRSKITQENYLSESKCVTLVKPVLNNGRVNCAEELTTVLTEVDYDIMKNCYDWDSLDISNGKFAYKNYLPKSIIEAILKLYQDKTVLKDVEGSEVEYLVSKGMLNSIYGMSVTDIIKDQAVYDDVWSWELADIPKKIQHYNDDIKRCLYYPWGIWVTAYARRNLWTGILAVGDDYIYSDTDSLKVLNYENHKPYIEWFDNQIIGKMKEMCEYYNLDPDSLCPKTKEGKVKMIGVWDFEGTYSKFKTLGAKRYLVLDNGKLKLTVAGLSKQNGIKHMLELAGGNVDEVFNVFNDSLYIPADKTGKMTHTYIDEEYKFQVTDFEGNTATVNPLTGVHLGNCDFTLNINEQYLTFIKNLADGYIYKGVNYTL